jgi:hypothetical protein
MAMPTRVITSDVIAVDETAVSVAGVGDRVVVAPDVIVAVERTAALPTLDFSGIRTQADQQSVSVAGFVTGDYGLYLDGNGIRVDVTATGQVLASDVTGIAVRGTGHVIANAGHVAGVLGVDAVPGSVVRIQNSGTITGSLTGIALVGSIILLTNTGTIAGNETGINVSSGMILNAGEITSNGEGIRAGNSTLIENTGTIASTGLAVTFLGTADQELINRGQILGGVSVVQGGTVIDTSSGSIGGLVTLFGTNVTYIGSAGRDRVAAAANASTIDLGAGDDTYRAGGLAQGSEVEGGAGIDVIDGRSFSGIEIDLAAGTVGVIGLMTDGFTGFENASGSGGNDRLTGDGGANRMRGHSGADTQDGGSGDDRLDGDEGADRLTGGSGNDTLNGGADDDTLDGGTGRDRLAGGLGRDLMTGGAEADVFVFRSLAEAVPAPGQFDRIADFAPGVDRIDLSGIDARPATLGDDAFTFVGTAAITAEGQLRLRTTGSATFVEASFDSATPVTLLRLDGVLTLTAADFVL